MRNISSASKWTVWATTFLLVWGIAFATVATAETRIKLTAEEQAYLVEHPVLRVHNETDWPPFNFFDDGKPQGFSIDYMNLLASMIGVEVKYVTGPTWNEFLGLMKSGDLDVMLNIVKTPERQKYLSYTKSYALNPNSILSRREAPYDNLQQLFGKTVALPKGFFYEEILKRDFPQIKLHLVKNVGESMKAVIFGKADAAVGELAVFNHLIDREMMTGLILSGEVELGSPHYSRLNIATRKDQPLLISMLRKAVAAVDQKDVRALRQRWVTIQAVASSEKPQLNLSAEEKTWLAGHKHMRFGINPGYPPFEFIDDEGAFSGMSSDFVRLLSQRLEITVELVPGLSWAEVIDGIKTHSLDFTPALAVTPERLGFLNFSRSHMAFPVVIVTRDDFALVGGLDDLKGATAALVRALAVTEKITKKHPDIVAKMVDTPLQALQSVALGKADATVMNLAVATYLIKKHGLANLKVAAPAEIDLPGLSFAVRKDWPEFAGILNKALASITPEEESVIRSKWAQVSYNTGIEVEEVLQVGGVAIVILIIFVVWNRRLRKEVDQRKLAEKSMEAAKNEAERLTQAKSDFIAVISHEIRTPMNGVLGMARLLTETELDEEQRGCVDTVVASGEALLAIIDDLLDISKFDAGKLDIESLPFIVDDVVEQAMALMRSRAEEKGLVLSSDVDAEIPTVVVGDPLRIRQIILNLISNAIKFTEKGTIEVDAKLDSQTDDTAVLSFTVTDTGKGIPLEDQGVLFSAYSQGSAAVARIYGGTGLGLAICRRLAHSMNGEISVESTLGIGSSFRFEAIFKIDRTTDAAALRTTHSIDQPMPANTPAARPLRVLQVEDNETNRAVVERALSRVGHHVSSVFNGAEAIEALQSGDFDVILMDRHMPVMDGIEATRRIRQMGQPMASIPIIGITAAASLTERQACIEAGMNDCLTKPVEAVKLRALLESLSSGKEISTPAPILENPSPMPIDLGQLSRILGEVDEGELYSMLNIFNREFPKLLESLHATIKDRDAVAVERVAHTAKGAAASTAATKLSDMLKQIESSAHLGSWSDIEARADAVAVEYESVVRFCASHRRADAK